jgi:hypothetical protein
MIIPMKLIWLQDFINVRSSGSVIFPRVPMFLPIKPIQLQVPSWRHSYVDNLLKLIWLQKFPHVNSPWSRYISGNFYVYSAEAYTSVVQSWNSIETLMRFLPRFI